MYSLQARPAPWLVLHIRLGNVRKREKVEVKWGVKIVMFKGIKGGHGKEIGESADRDRDVEY